MKIEQETLKFDSLENFEIWKGNIERTTNASFVKHRGTYIGKKCNTTKFECHRSGIFKSRSKGEGHNKHHQSVKIDSYCPASIKLTQNGIKYEVEFIKTHVGHINTLAKLFRPKTVIQISMANILNEGRDKKGNDNLERLHSLTSKDLHKIQQSDIRQADIRHKIDMSSRVLTNEVENDEDNFECIKEEELHIKPEIEEPSLYIPETPMEENCDQDNLEKLHLFTKDLHNIQQSSNTLKQLSEVRHKNDTNSGALTNEVENDGDNSDELECIKEEELHIKPEVEECTPYIAEAPIEENCDQDNLERLHLHKNVHNIQQSSITLNRLPGIRHKNDTSSRALTNEVQNDGDNFDKLYCIKQEELHIKSEIEESTPYISENPIDENSDHQEGRSIQQKMFVIYYFK